MRPDQVSRPRVLLVSPVADFKGGAEVVLRQMWANPYIDVVVATPQEGPIATAAAADGHPVCFYRPGAMVRVHRPPRAGPIAAAAWDALGCARRLGRLAVEHRCGIIHSNGLKTHVLCAILGRRARVRTLVHLHDIPYRRSERAIWTMIGRRVSRVVMVSRPCWPGAALPGHVDVVRNGIAMVRSSLTPFEVSQPVRLGFVGRYHPNKGLDLLLDWFAAVRAAGIDATLTMRGRPDPDLPGYWEAIRERIACEGHSASIREEGWVSGDARFAGLDMLLVTSQTPDPAPLVVPEAMSAGIVVAGYPAGGIPGMIVDGRTGLLVTSGPELAKRLALLLAEPGSLGAVRDQAFQAVQQEFGMDRFYRRLAEIYADVV